MNRAGGKGVNFLLHICFVNLPIRSSSNVHLLNSLKIDVIVSCVAHRMRNPFKNTQLRRSRPNRKMLAICGPPSIGEIDPTYVSPFQSVLLELKKPAGSHHFMSQRPGMNRQQNWGWMVGEEMSGA